MWWMIIFLWLPGYSFSQETVKPKFSVKTYALQDEAKLKKKGKIQEEDIMSVSHRVIFTCPMLFGKRIVCSAASLSKGGLQGWKVDHDRNTIKAPFLINVGYETNDSKKKFLTCQYGKGNEAVFFIKTEIPAGWKCVWKKLKKSQHLGKNTTSTTIAQCYKKEEMSRKEWDKRQKRTIQPVRMRPESISNTVPESTQKGK